MHSNIYFFDELSTQQQLIKTLSQTKTLPSLSAFVDGRGLSCPLPLLKAKIALKRLSPKDSLYLVATDKNASNDIRLFCQKNQLDIDTWADDTKETDIIFHFVISKKA